MGHRDAPVSRGSQGGGDAGNDLERNVFLHQQFQFLAAPAEEEGVAALEPHHVLAGLSLLQQDAVDFLLGHRVISSLLAHIDALGGGRNQAENLLAYQPVIDHHVCMFQGLTALQGQQPRITGACTPG